MEKKGGGKGSSALTFGTVLAKWIRQLPASPHSIVVEIYQRSIYVIPVDDLLTHLMQGGVPRQVRAFLGTRSWGR